MIEKNHEKRYASVGEISRDLRNIDLAQPNGKESVTLPTDIGQNIPAVQSDQSSIAVTDRKQSKFGMIALGLLGLALIAGLLAWRSLRSTHEQAMQSTNEKIVVPEGMVLIPAGEFDMGTDRGDE